MIKIILDIRLQIYWNILSIKRNLISIAFNTYNILLKYKQNKPFPQAKNCCFSFLLNRRQLSMSTSCNSIILQNNPFYFFLFFAYLSLSFELYSKAHWLYFADTTATATLMLSCLVLKCFILKLTNISFHVVFLYWTCHYYLEIYIFLYLFHV